MGCYRSKRIKQFIVNEPGFDENAALFFNELLTELERRYEEKKEFHLKEASNAIKLKFSNNPGSLYSMLRGYLMSEQGFWENREKTADAPNITRQLVQLSLMMESNKSCVLNFESKYNKTVCQLNNLNASQAYPLEQNDELPVRQMAVKQMITELSAVRTELGQSLTNVIRAVSKVQDDVINVHLRSWKRDQEVSSKEFKPEALEDPISLDQIQVWCEQLAAIIYETLTAVCKLKQFVELKSIGATTENSAAKDPLEKLEEEVETLLKKLVGSTAVIEQQPPQVVKTHGALKATKSSEESEYLS